MNILDENVLEDQRQLLRQWRVPVRQIGQDIGRKGMQDENIIPFLLTLRRPTFFTSDFDFYDRRLCHAQYCLVCIESRQSRTATFVRRFLRHSAFDTAAKRMGKVIRLSSVQLVVQELHRGGQIVFDWED
ncbi:MAG: hypothetical protein FJ147_07845 [Deltaproteobacteria bacterium]|nr:hypothetical protein [Deltaproteobacteria bacterium]